MSHIAAIFITLFVGLVSVFVTLVLARRTGRSHVGTRDLISNITGLFSASQKLGIVTAYESRASALRSPSTDGVLLNLSNLSASSFVTRVESEPKLVVVGSSLLGMRMYVPHLPAIIASRIAAGLETKFMLTHPCFSQLRESQENRKEGQITREIENMIDLLVGCGLDLAQCLRFYRGTPTCFVIITSEAMLVNPYPYQVEAFSSFCLEVKRTPRQILAAPGSSGDEVRVPQQIGERYREEFKRIMDEPRERQFDYRLHVGPDIYGQFYWYHYLLPWFSQQSVTYQEYQEVCSNCSCLERGFHKGECQLRAPADQASPADESEQSTMDALATTEGKHDG